MTKYRCPKFGCNGIGLPAGTRKPFRAGKGVVGDTPGYLLDSRINMTRLVMPLRESHKSLPAC